jgi:hypothetical protein
VSGGGGGMLDVTSGGLLGAITGNSNRLDLVRNIPFICCNYIPGLSCDHTELLLNGGYNIQSPLCGLCRSYSITNGNKHVGSIHESGYWCCLSYNLVNAEGEHVMTVAREVGFCRNQWEGTDSEGNKASSYDIYKPLCCGGIEAKVEIYKEDETAKMLSLALVSYL